MSETERQTPGDIISEHTALIWDWDSQPMLDAFAASGYVIVHRDDVPEDFIQQPVPDGPYAAYLRGWNDCREYIFVDLNAD